MKEFLLTRQVFGDTFTLGEVFLDGQRICYTCEDKDRKLEDGGEKVYGETCIPRGTYKVTLSFSHKFQKILPELHDVDQFDGVRIHGGNTDKDTLACVLVGIIPTENGVAKCAPAMTKIMSIIEAAENVGEECWITIK